MKRMHDVWVKVSVPAKSLTEAQRQVRGELHHLTTGTVWKATVAVNYTGLAAKLGARGGSSTSEAKAAAARANGLKGGRTHKQAAAAAAVALDVIVDAVDALARRS